VYLFDQLLKGRLVPGMRVLDAGCGRGRNLAYLLRAGFEVCAVDTGIEDRVRPLGGRRFLLPDGTERFLADEAMLAAAAARLGGEAVEPLRTVNVGGLRCMAAWCLRRPRQPSAGSDR
jgi:SAM-dependent methyltransferase